MTEKRPIDANDLMARFFRKECLMQGHSAAASAAYKDAQKTVAAGIPKRIHRKSKKMC